jgi:hypothetical protein
MTVEFLTVLTCWPNTARPAHALAYLRTRRARMAPHVPWFYELPRSVRWLLAGTDRVPSLLAFAVSAPTIDEESRQVWRKGLVALNELGKSTGDEVSEPSAAPADPGNTRELGSSDLTHRRRAAGCRREIPKTAPQRSAAIPTTALAPGRGRIGRCGVVADGVRLQRARDAEAPPARIVVSDRHRRMPVTRRALSSCGSVPTLPVPTWGERRARCRTTGSQKSTEPTRARSPPPPLTCEGSRRVGATTRGGHR